MDSFDVIQFSPNPLGAGPNPVQSVSQARDPNQSSPVTTHLQVVSTYMKEFRAMNVTLYETVPFNRRVFYAVMNTNVILKSVE